MFIKETFSLLKLAHFVIMIVHRMYKRKKIPEMYTSKYLDLKMFLYKAKKKQKIQKNNQRKILLTCLFSINVLYDI